MSNGISPTEREELLQQIATAESKAQESQIEAAVYRNQLIECEGLAQTAIHTKNPSLLHGALSKASITLHKNNVKEWGKDWGDAWEMDIKWLRRALESLKEIKNAASQLSVEDNSENNVLKARILEQATHVLVQHVPSSITLE